MSTNCHRMILFMTDGSPQSSTGPQDSQEILDLIQARNTPTVDASIFTYSFGADAERELTRVIACQNNGVYQHIDLTATAGVGSLVGRP